MGTFTSLRRGVAVCAVAVSLVGAMATSAYSAGGPGGGHGVGGGIGGGRPSTETTNNLSVPAVFVPDSAAFPALTCDGTALAPADVATNSTTWFPALDPTTNLPDGVAAGDYYVQGEDRWQASCTTGGASVGVVDWGDNLEGSAALKVGSPVRVEVGLFTDPSAYSAMTGFTVAKLTDELDRYATYGTRGAAGTATELRVWASDARFGITGPATTPLQPMTAEINATGRVVYGYNWRPSAPGIYTIHFEAPSVGVTSSDITVTVKAAPGGGGRR